MCSKCMFAQPRKDFHITWTMEWLETTPLRNPGLSQIPPNRHLAMSSTLMYPRDIQPIQINLLCLSMTLSSNDRHLEQTGSCKMTNFPNYGDHVKENFTGQYINLTKIYEYIYILDIYFFEAKKKSHMFPIMDNSCQPHPIYCHTKSLWIQR